MPTVRSSREQRLLALACALWSTGFLADETPALYVVPPVVLVGVLGLHRWPVPAALVVAGADLLAILLGVSPESPALLAPALVSLYSVGRGTGRLAGTGVVLAFLAVAVVADDFSVATGIFAFFLYGATWGFGVLVRHRAGAARQARDEAARMAREDPAAVTARVVAEERHRLATDTVTVIRSAVDDMRRDALAAERTLDPTMIRSVQSRGGAAVAELRRLLGLLRTEPEAEQPDKSPAAPRKPWQVDLLAAVLVAAVGLGDLAVMPGGTGAPLSIALTMLLYATLALRRTEPALACLAATVPMALSAVLQTPTTRGYAEAIALVLLAWGAATHAGRWSWAALVTLSAATLFGTWLQEAGNVPLVAALFALPAFAGHAWTERDREQRAADLQSEHLQNVLDSTVSRAVTAERLRIARELHDVTSHAVGVMVLQAGAADALRTGSADEARNALREVRAAGAQALAELSVLLGVIDGGSAAAGPGTSDPGTLEPALEALAGRIRATGARVEMHIGGLPTDPVVSAAAFRVVQEALTNVARHAPGSLARVEVGAVDGVLEVKVLDDGPGGTGTGGAGFGLAGLAERVGSLGGHVSAGPRPIGGFAVHASLPVRRRVDAGPTAGAAP